MKKVLGLSVVASAVLLMIGIQPKTEVNATNKDDQIESQVVINDILHPLKIIKNLENYDNFVTKAPLANNLNSEGFPDHDTTIVDFYVDKNTVATNDIYVFSIVMSTNVTVSTVMKEDGHVQFEIPVGLFDYSRLTGITPMVYGYNLDEGFSLFAIMLN